MKKLKTREFILTGLIVSALAAPYFGAGVSAAETATNADSTTVDSGIVLKATKI